MSWLAPRKVRNTIIVGDTRMLVYDDMDADEPIKLHDKRFVLPEGDSFGAHQLTYRTGDTVAPYVSADEPLANQLQHFMQCIRGARVPLRRVVRRRRRRGAGGGRPLVPRGRRARSRWSTARRSRGPRDAGRPVRPEPGRARRPAGVARGAVAGGRRSRRDGRRAGGRRRRRAVSALDGVDVVRYRDITGRRHRSASSPRSPPASSAPSLAVRPPPPRAGRSTCCTSPTHPTPCSRSAGGCVGPEPGSSTTSTTRRPSSPPPSSGATWCSTVSCVRWSGRRTAPPIS